MELFTTNPTMATRKIGRTIDAIPRVKKEEETGMDKTRTEAEELDEDSRSMHVKETKTKIVRNDVKRLSANAVLDHTPWRSVGWRFLNKLQNGTSHGEQP